MKAFEVYVNGEKVCTAGVATGGILMAGLRWVVLPSGAAGLNADITALDVQAAEHLIWSAPSIKAGDEVTIRAVEADGVDPTRERVAVDPNRFSDSPPG